MNINKLDEILLDIWKDWLHLANCAHEKNPNEWRTIKTEDKLMVRGEGAVISYAWRRWLLSILNISENFIPASTGTWQTAVGLRPRDTLEKW